MIFGDIFSTNKYFLGNYRQAPSVSALNRDGEKLPCEGYWANVCARSVAQPPVPFRFLFAKRMDGVSVEFPLKTFCCLSASLSAT